MPISFSLPSSQSESRKYSDGIKKKTQNVFKGINHTLGACDGEIYDMLNMCGDDYPLASPRKPRALIRTLEKPNGITAHDGIYFVDGTGFYKLSDGIAELKGEVSDSKKFFAHIGAYVIVMPDKVYYNRLTDEFGSLEARWFEEASFADGTYAGIEAEGCRIISSGEPFDFQVGDAVTISGSDNDENNQTIIIREISDDRMSLGFYEHSFICADAQSITISRDVPDMDFICENENRLWGCKGSTIYASKPGDPFNFNVFDGLKSDSYSVSVGSAGDFTGCISYLGYPIFFKEERVYKVYGSKPSDFQVMSSASLGVMRGAAGTLAIAGETLYYLSHAGVMAYNGGVPEIISQPLGDYCGTAAYAGSDGVKYYICFDDVGSFCYDTRSRMWYREDGFDAVGFARESGLYALNSDGRLWLFEALDGDRENETEISSMLEFADFIENSPNRKATSKLQLRVELEECASLTVEMSFDDGKYITIKHLRAPERMPQKRSYYLPLQIKRCDHFRVRLRGKGIWRLYSLTRECSIGSELN
ncbi:MAG: hypothetical protein HFE63_01290 [Clostridiales bacterium]|nr:hypothetical protein [Clostridiales bacterium]